MATYNKNTSIQLFIMILCLVVFHLLLLLPESDAVSSGKPVTHLPGLALQPLPFHLETGYIGVGDNENYQLFYYFVKSDRNPKEDPLVLWLTGGPRCSAFSGLALEVGPISMAKEEYKSGSLPKLTLNPNSWTKTANIIFLDAPVYSGFSYSKASHDPVMTDTESAKNTHEFLIKWLIQNPEFQSNPLYVSGDSYSGIIVPILVQQLIRDMEDGMHPFLNFKGYSLGNPVTYIEMEYSARVEYAHNMGLISYELYQSMKVNCNGNFLNFDLSNPNCLHHRQVFEDLISGINLSQILEPLCTVSTLPKLKEMTKYSERRSLEKTREDLSDEQQVPYYSCWRLSDMSDDWANNAEVRKALHVREGTVEKWIRCNRNFTQIPYEFNVKSSVDYHRNVSTKGYRSLIYSGDHDMKVSHITTESWVRSLPNLSVIEEWRPWYLSGQIAGYTRSYSNGLTYATVKGGGHEAAGYKPAECYAMFERWVSNTSL
ncbi:hypothetical protein MKW94_004893 [Papaver nudicaule]|uniref:Uncharacterized protein n=1 Tax=Papaver nudicaule TaxID=74823 RepID=A0AA41VIG7_PAPNU|nr:hypothetical protein [Papaver nudicaule]